MKKDAEQRMKQIEQLRSEDALEKEKKRIKQVELRKVMDLDAKEKRNHRDRNSAM